MAHRPLRLQLSACTLLRLTDSKKPNSETIQHTERVICHPVHFNGYVTYLRETGLSRRLGLEAYKHEDTRTGSLEMQFGIRAQ